MARRASDGSDYTGRSYFVQLMNQKAQELGCTNTHFTNPHGPAQREPLLLRPGT